MDDQEKALRQARKLGEFFARLAEEGKGIHPDAGGDTFDHAEQRTRAYSSSLSCDLSGYSTACRK